MFWQAQIPWLCSNAFQERLSGIKTVKAAMQMNGLHAAYVLRLLSLPVLTWSADKGLGRLAHKMPHCKNTVNQDLSLSVFKGEQVSCRGCK